MVPPAQIVRVLASREEPGEMVLHCSSAARTKVSQFVTTTPTVRCLDVVDPSITETFLPAAKATLYCPTSAKPTVKTKQPTVFASLIVDLYTVTCARDSHEFRSELLSG